MDRREALTTLTALAAGTGLTITPVTTRQADGVQLVVFKSVAHLSDHHVERIRDTWAAVTRGTALEGTKCAVLMPGLEMELVRVTPDGRITAGGA